MELFATHKFPLATELYGWIRRGAGFNEFRGIAVELFENLQSKFTSLKKPLYAPPKIVYYAPEMSFHMCFNQYPFSVVPFDYGHRQYRKRHAARPPERFNENFSIADICWQI